MKMEVWHNRVLGRVLVITQLVLHTRSRWTSVRKPRKNSQLSWYLKRHRRWWFAAPSLREFGSALFALWWQQLVQWRGWHRGRWTRWHIGWTFHIFSEKLLVAEGYFSTLIKFITLLDLPWYCSGVISPGFEIRLPPFDSLLQPWKSFGSESETSDSWKGRRLLSTSQTVSSFGLLFFLNKSTFLGFSFEFSDSERRGARQQVLQFLQLQPLSI